MPLAPFGRFAFPVPAAGICALLAGILAAGSFGKLSPQALAGNQPHPAVARIVVTEPGAVSYGSGTLVDVQGDYGLVITNWHVVQDGGGQATVVFPGGFVSPAKVARVDRDWDLAALVIWRPPVEPLPVASSIPRQGDFVTIAGYGAGDYRAATGKCTQFVSPSERHPAEMIEVSAQARQGDSGGPILNDRGELAGVLFGAGRGTTTGSHAARVRLFLSGLVPQPGEPPDVSHIAARANVTPPSADLSPSIPPVQPSLPHPRPGQTLEPPVVAMTPSAPSDEATVDQLDDTFPAESFDWTTLLGGTLLDQGKSFLAIFGSVAIGYHLLRRLAGAA